MRIRDGQCETCIYRPDSPLRERLPVLDAEIRDPAAPYHFARPRACHSEDWPSGETICSGFAARHGDDCTAVQLVWRLGALAAALGRERS